MTGPRLTVAERVEIASTVALARCCGEVLSPFEAELIEELGQRMADLGDDARVTLEEWRAVRAAYPALRARAAEPA